MEEEGRRYHEGAGRQGSEIGQIPRPADTAPSTIHSPATHPATAGKETRLAVRTRALF